MTTCFIIAYDIKNKSRLQRLQRLISNQLWQLQYSVYYGRMTHQAMDSLIVNIKKIIHKDDDDVRIYEVEPIENAFVIGKRDEDIMMISDSGELLI